MLSYLMVAVFLRGLITGEAANFFGKKIALNEINYVIIVFLVMPVGVPFLQLLHYLFHLLRTSLPIMDHKQLPTSPTTLPHALPITDLALQESMHLQAILII